MNITKIKLTKHEKGTIINITIECGINKWFVTQFHKEEKVAQQFKRFFEQHKKDWFEFYYLIPRAHIQNKQLEGKYHAVLGISWGLYPSKKEKDEIDY